MDLRKEKKPTIVLIAERGKKTHVENAVVVVALSMVIQITKGLKILSANIARKPFIQIRKPGDFVADNAIAIIANHRKY